MSWEKTKADAIASDQNGAKVAKRSEELIDRLGQGKVKLKLKTSQAQIIVKEQSVFVIGETLVVITEPIV
ncbi:hypothetical protein CDAR_87531 [Caerostris darwini]|uniref:Uncharacterized protein n=1 Tax=Caerostris darwini TaxID=1538125 RepID=A0AAV4TUR6_9ARAC|nr:hypothetical protein CDAR_87531 [Caerostris darwini]